MILPVYNIFRFVHKGLLKKNKTPFVKVKCLHIGRCYRINSSNKKKKKKELTEMNFKIS